MGLSGVQHFLGLSLSFVITYYLVPIMITVAYRLRILDCPDGNVKKQKKSVPYLGGIAVYVGFIVSLGTVYPFENHLLWFLLGSTLLLFVGLIDDLFALSPLQKIIGQVIAVQFFIQAGMHLHPLFFNSIISLIFSAFWMLCVINAFNLVDVMDGLSTLLGMVAVGSFACIGFWSAQYGLSLLMISLFGSLTAFFCYNKPPASIYLGDSGSLFLGGFLASTPLLISWSFFKLKGYLAPVIILGVPLLILGIPLLEMGMLVMIRTAKGIPFYHASPHHFSLYLLQKRWEKWAILTFAAGSSLFLSVCAFCFLIGLIALPLLVCILSIFCVSWLYIVFLHNRKKPIRSKQNAKKRRRHY